MSIDPNIDAKSAQDIHKRLNEIKGEITELGHLYVSSLKKPIPLPEFVKKLEPWAEVEKSMHNLMSDIILPF